MSTLENIFASTTIPSLNSTDNTTYELGTEFSSNISGEITAIRYYKASGETGTHTGDIWSSTGKLLDTVTFTNETSSGWQTAILSTPLLINANTDYMVSVNINKYYANTPNGFNKPITNGNLTGIDGYYGTTGTDPTQTWDNSNYFVDVNFTPTPVIGTVTISGTDTQGNTLTATVAEPNQLNGVIINYQWQQSANTGTTWTNIAGATGQTFTLTQAQVNNEVKVTANYTDNAGTKQNIVSTPTSSVAGLPGSLAFSAPTFTEDENGTVVMAVTVTRTGGSYGSVSATVTPSNGTAIAPTNYNNTKIPVSFANGDTTSKTITIPVVNNTQTTSNETINLTLSNPTGGAKIGAQSTAILTVLPDTTTPVNLSGLSSQPTPTGNPTLPVGANVFNPSFTGTVSAQAPVISNWTQTANAGDTIAVTGNLFTPSTKFWVYGQTQAGNSVLTQATVQSISGNTASITLPTSLPSGSEYLLWAQNSSGSGQPVEINQTSAWWVQSTVTAGNVASVFGENLSQNNGTTNSNVYIENPATGQGSFAKVDAVNPYKVDFTVPTGLADGNYNVYVNNGDGGQYSWSAPLTMTVNNELYNTKGSVFNVKNYGATGNGVTNDITAIDNAIAAAEQVPGSTVYFPAGTYSISMPSYGSYALAGANNITLEGAGQGQTTLQIANGSLQNYMFVDDSDGINGLTFENMTMSGNTTNDPNLTNLIHIRNSSNVQFNNVNFQGQGATNTLDLSGDSNVSINNSSITGTGVFLGNAQQVFINGDTFYGAGYNDGLIFGFGVSQLSITNTTAENLDPTNPNNIVKRFFVDQPIWGVSQNQYIANNQTIALGPTAINQTDQNSGEQILWETSNGYTPTTLGAVTGATANTVTLASSGSSAPDSSNFLTIIGGTGIGQSLQIQSANSTTNTYTLDGNWNVKPDSSSVLVASRMPSNVAVYNNQIQGQPDYASRITGSAGVEPYYGAVNMDIVNNTFSDVRAGVNLYTGESTASYINPVNFTQITNNQFVNDLTGVQILGNSTRQGTTVLGNSINNNTFNNVGTAFSFQENANNTLGNSPLPDANQNIFQGNTLTGTIGTSVSISQDNAGDILNNVLLNNHSPLGNLNPGVVSGNLTL